MRSPRMQDFSILRAFLVDLIVNIALPIPKKPHKNIFHFFKSSFSDIHRDDVDVSGENKKSGSQCAQCGPGVDY